MNRSPFKSRVACVLLSTWVSTVTAAGNPSVNFYTWSDFIAPETPSEFTKETHIPLMVNTFNSAEVMQSKLMAGHSGYDVVMATSNVLPNLIRAGLLQELDRSQLTGWKHLDPEILNKLQINDPENRYAVPFLWGTTGIGYDVDKIKAALGEKAPVNSWDLVFNEKNISQLKSCGVAMLDSPSEIISIALHYLGLPSNSQNPDDYKKAEDLLMRIRPYIRYFDSGKLSQELANGNICLFVGWAGSASVAMDLREKVKSPHRVAYSIPREGALWWSENLVVVKDSPHPNQGFAFINYLLKPNVIAKTAIYLGYPVGNKDAIIPFSQKFIDNPELKPSAEVIKTLFPLKPLPLKYERIRTRTWSKIKSGL